ncbi:hypothetical protein SAMN04487819_108268 [Actinopolyspora alba]|uniref:Uncharacterized protein n=1 Tax=Actinopolyspora alba TaxID=673379 RepID=A0A1I1Y9A3_9ACTN|nr:hypothetical protein [Actinopolyspora alba]SFE16157.1 hypothetical protein SAMN04487819_108268 [Actinopolyspora alba]
MSNDHSHIDREFAPDGGHEFLLELRRHYDRWRSGSRALPPAQRAEHTRALAHAVDRFLDEAHRNDELPDVIRCALRSWRDQLHEQATRLSRAHVTGPPPCR